MGNKCINNFLDNTSVGRREFITTALVGIAAVAAGAAILPSCAGLMPKPDFYPTEGDKHTITYTDKTGKKNTVYDLSGLWEANYLGSREVVEIKQTGNEFKGYKKIGNSYVGKDRPTITGEVNGNLVECETHYSDNTITYATSKLTENVDCFECQHANRTKFKKIK